MLELPARIYRPYEILLATFPATLSQDCHRIPHGLATPWDTAHFKRRFATRLGRDYRASSLREK
jgi:hypothetical protein